MKKTATLSALARMMAGENISITHDPRATTAMFDLRQRKLTLPMWKDMSDDLYDLFLSHEIGHARETPLEGWHGSIHRLGRGFKGYLNVIEDARIERLVKARFPALNRIYGRAYQELMNRDFFGLKKHGINIDKLPLIDRINIRTKCGSIVPIRFTAQEQVYVDRALATETFAEVETLAEELFNMERARKKPGVKNALDQLQSLQDMLEKFRQRGVEGMEDGDGYADGEVVEREVIESDEEDVPKPSPLDMQPADMEDMSEEEREQMMQGAEKQLDAMREMLSHRNKAPKEESDGTEDDNEQLKSTTSNDDLNDYSKLEERLAEAKKKLEEEVAKAQKEGFFKDDEIVAQTDDEFRSNEDSLLEDENTRVHHFGEDNQMLFFDDNYDLTKFVVPVRRLQQRINADLIAYTNSYNGRDQMQKMKDFLRGEQKVISQLAAEFEMRKNAAQYARAGTAKTGEINLKNIHKARFSEDLFKRMTKMPDGKSHGMIMYFDQSGSMESCYGRTLGQVITLVEFCRRMAIPYAVYGFNDAMISREHYMPSPGDAYQSYSVPAKPTPGRVQISNGTVHLKEYFNSSQSPAEHNRSCQIVWMLRGCADRPNYETLHGTPMNSALLLSGKMVKQFQKDTRVDIVNVLFLTDGEASDAVDVNASGYGWSNGTARVVYGEKMSPMFKRDSYNRKTATAAMARLMSDATGANYLGVYIPSTQQSGLGAMRSFANTLYDPSSKHQKRKRAYTMARDGFVATAGYGFDEFFIIKPLRNNSDDMEFGDIAEKASTKQIADQLTKVVQARTSRAFLSVFAAAISGRIVD